MVKLCLVFFLFSCGCFINSQDFNAAHIKQVGDVAIIDNDNAELSEAPKVAIVYSKSNSKKGKSKVLHTRKAKTHIKLYLEYSRKKNPEKLKSQKLIYTNSINDTFFLKSSRHTFSTVLCSTVHPEIKKDFFHCVNCRVFSLDHVIKKNTYYYLSFKDTGKLYQFFNRPPPSNSFS